MGDAATLAHRCRCARATYHLWRRAR